MLGLKLIHVSKSGHWQPKEPAHYKSRHWSEAWVVNTSSTVPEELNSFVRRWRSVKYNIISYILYGFILRISIEITTHIPDVLHWNERMFYMMLLVRQNSLVIWYKKNALLNDAE